VAFVYVFPDLLGQVRSKPESNRINRNQICSVSSFVRNRSVLVLKKPNEKVLQKSKDRFARFSSSSGVRSSKFRWHLQLHPGLVVTLPTRMQDMGPACQ
jgi:hypothetical protein